MITLPSGARMKLQHKQEKVASTPGGQGQRGAQKLHQQIEALIRDSIEKGQLKVGDQLPTEAELCRQFKVSRSTVRLALTRLENAGMISRTRGRGTFLRETVAGIHAESPRATQLEVTNGRRALRATQRNTIGVVLSFASEIDVMQMN